MSRRQRQEPTVGTLVRMPEGVRCFEVGEDDVGDPVRHYRAVDTLGLMHRAGSIDAYQHAAGEHFAQDFAAAFRSGCKTARLQPGVGHGGSPPGLEETERHANAARRVDAALAAVGGADSPGAAALWYVAGLGLSVRAWSQREGWNGRTLNKHEASGMLIAALAVLARFYGYRRD
ncbi:hypothetical protein U5801_21330 [Lamprobacter modestohalophilus]|uniref:hypothetical protein n=1 Tax=Lamprobacter modestohalophilus TaxID=1064514 RepID=UPI002ADEEC97|nr:hypothetical protein [Lamprobacter modestohalophilus]MEA1052327.1 hypothetical protein [Lamprobacter modestohalophilus]